MQTPYSRRVAVLAAALLAVSAFASSLFAAGNPRQMRVFFLNAGVQTEATGKLMLVSNRAQTFFHITVSGLEPGTYDVLLNGAVVDTITVNADGTGRLAHASHVNPRRNTGPLPYDPMGGEIEIMASGVAVLTATIPSDITQASVKTTIHVDLTNLGLQPTATAEGTLVVRNGQMHFEVEVEGALPGTYDLVVDGVTVGQIVVDASGFGQLELDSRPSEDDELVELLTFDPRGSTISVIQLGSTVFTEVFPEQ